MTVFDAWWAFVLLALAVALWQLRPVIAEGWAAVVASRHRYSAWRFAWERAKQAAIGVAAVAVCLSLAYLVWDTRVARVVRPEQREAR